MVIYHHAKPIIQEAAVGAALRPLRMLQAFRAVGEEVIEVTGPGPARVEKASRIPASLPEEAIFYSESVVVPPALTWLRRQPWRMNFDYHLVRISMRAVSRPGSFTAISTGCSRRPRR